MASKTAEAQRRWTEMHDQMTARLDRQKDAIDRLMKLNVSAVAGLMEIADGGCAQPVQRAQRALAEIDRMTGGSVSSEDAQD